MLSLTRLFRPALATLLVALPATAQSEVRIDFEPPTVSVGDNATNSYVDQGLRFPSQPVIDRDGGSQVLRQGRIRRDGPDPLPTDVICSPLEMELAPAMDARSVRFSVLNRHLRYYRVTAFSGSVEVDRSEFFPRSGPRGPLPPYQRDVTVRADASEGPITRIVADPPSDCFDLMVIDDLVIDNRGPVTPIDPAPLPDMNSVYAAYYEITQGVMSRMTRSELRGNSPDTRLMALPTKSLSFVEGRDTVVRYFLDATEADVADFPAELEVSVTYKDGTRRTKRITENSAGGSRAIYVDRSTPEADRRRARYFRRARLDQSHDYVIPARFLDNAASMILILRRPETFEPMSRVNVAFVGPYRQGINLYRVQGIGPDASAGGPPNRAVGSLATQFLKELYPVSRNIVVRENPILITNGDSAGNSQTTNCPTYLGALIGAAAGADPIADVNYWTNVFLVVTPPGCGGLGRYNSIGAMTNLNFDTVAHEVGHNIGINHASGAHGEPGAGMDWEPWPYFHGSIGTPDEGQGYTEGVFGALAITTTPGRDEIEDWGSWIVTIIPPCQGGPGQVFPTCTAAETPGPGNQVAHDYMSYGPRTNAAPFGQQAWISDINFYRLQRFYQDCVVLDPRHRFNTTTPAGLAVTTPCNSATAVAASDTAGSAPADSFVFTGRIENDRIVDLISIRKLAVNPPNPDPNARHEYSIVLLNDAGKTLDVRPFTPHPLSDDARSKSEIFSLIIPFREDIARAEIRRGNDIIHKLEKGVRQPRLSLLTPNGGETWKNPREKVAWRIQEPNTTIFVQYSPDKGQSWYPLALLGGRTQSVEIDVNSLQSSSSALIYVSATRGLNSTVAISPRPFTIISNNSGGGAPGLSFEEDCVSHNPARLALRRINGRWKIVEGDHWIADFGTNRAEARRSLTIMKRFRFDQTCYVGRPDPSMTYHKSQGAVPSGPSGRLDCIEFDANSVSIVKEGARWLLRSNRSRMKMFDREDEARRALEVIQTYRLNRQCYVGRPQPSFTFWLAGG